MCRRLPAGHGLIDMPALVEQAAPAVSDLEAAADRVGKMYFTECGWAQCNGCGAILPSSDSFFPDHSRCNLCFREGR